jgi:ATP-dependent Clp protease ATP-binding subunit ClpC
MFEIYTQSARRVIFHAQEAMRRGSPYIESEYLLLGVLRENETVTTRLGGTNGRGFRISAKI